MTLAATVLTLIASLEHVYFFVLEVFLWQKPLGLRTFGQDATRAAATARLAVSQGFYNLFLAVGLLWSVLSPDPALRLYSLGFAVAAGIVGGITVGIRVFLVQGGPAAIALVLSLLAR